MHIKSIVSAATLAIALGFAGTAAAQTMIGNQNVSEADQQRVQVYCDDLQTRENAAVGTDSTAGDAGEAEASNDIAAENSTAAVGSVDMTAITLENCIEAGFIERIGG